MKIVFIAPFGIRPKGTVIARMLPLAAELQKSGHSVTIVAPPYTNPEDSGRTETLRGVKLVNITLPDAGKAAGTPVIVWRMFRAVLAESPDLIHLFKPKGYGGLAVMLIGLLRKAGGRFPPVYVDTDDWEGKGGMNELHDYSRAERLLFAFQEKNLLRSACGVTVASRELETLVRGLGLPADRVRYLPNCVEPVRAGSGDVVRSRLGIAGSVPVVLLYTRFFEFSQERLYGVFREVHRQNADVRFLVIGKGRRSEEEGLMADSVRHGYRDALVMAGWVEPAELPDFLSAADIAVYPMDDNLVNRAKCPAKLTELLRAGVPVVADAVGQVPEYIKDGESGVLSDPADLMSMAGAVIGLLDQRELRERLGNAGRQRLLDSFTWSCRVGELYALYAANGRQTVPRNTHRKGY